MSLEVWLENAEKNKRRLQNNLRVLKKALENCSEKTKQDLAEFQDQMLMVEDAIPDNHRLGSAYFNVTNMFEEVTKLTGEFHPPMDFLTQDGVKDALLDMMKVAGEEKEPYPKPDLRPASQEEVERAKKKYRLLHPVYEDEEPKEPEPDINVIKAGLRQAAYDASPTQLAAQYMAFKDLPKEVTPEQLLNAIDTIPRREKSSVLRRAMQNKEAADSLLDGTLEAFDRSYESVIQKDRSKKVSFKEFSDEITKRYREGKLTYAQLELNMSALRAVTPGANDNERENEQTYVGDFMDKVAELEKQNAEINTEEYQKALADGYTDYSDLSVECLDNIYGMTIEFHPEYVDPNKPKDSTIGYLQENVERCLPSFELSDVKVGSKPVSNREFASLANLAVYDPSIGGSVVSAPKTNKFVTLDTPNKWVAADNHSHYVMNCANSYREINGVMKATPDSRIEDLLHTMIPGGRNMAKDALEAYQQGNLAPLAKLIANGIDMGVNYGKYGTLVPKERLGRKNLGLAVDWNEDSDLMESVNTDTRTNYGMMQGALDLLDRDPKLKKAVINAGLKEEDIRAARAFEMSRQVQKAGWAAMDRLAEDASGNRKLSGQEKEQCVIAMLRMRAMVTNIKEWSEEAINAPEYKAFEEKYEKELTADLEKKESEGIPDYMRTDEGSKVWKPWQHELSVKRYSCYGLPPVYREMAKDGVAALDARINAVSRRAAREMTSQEIMNGFQNKDGIYEKEGLFGKNIKTTARDIYDQLTKTYKAGGMNYTLYEDRLRTMRELTGGNPKAKIDLPTIDGVLKKNLQEKELQQKTHLDAVESHIEAMLGTDSGKLPSRVRHIDDPWRLTPRINEGSVMKPNPYNPQLINGAYTREQYEQIKPVVEGPDENFLHLSDSEMITEEDFAGLGIAATHTFPEIGLVAIDMKSKNAENPNIIQDPAKNMKYIATFRNPYFTDLDQGLGVARDGIGSFIKTSIVPGREKVVEALRSYQAGKGSPKELAKILGTGLHQLVKTTTVANSDGAGEMKSDAMLECAYIGRLAKFAERNPALMTEALKENYLTQEDIDKAKGFGLLYQISAGADLAKEKLTASSKGEIQLAPEERKACVELMLMRKALSDSACRQAIQNVPEEKTNEIALAYSTLGTELEKSGMSKAEARELSMAEVNLRMQESIGTPDYLRTLGSKGLSFAKEYLDSYMPNREPFLEQTDAEILQALAAKPLSQGDPFLNKEYTTKPAYNHDEVLKKSLQESQREKSAPQPVQKTL